jgi:hypothetical protein
MVLNIRETAIILNEISLKVRNVGGVSVSGQPESYQIVGITLAFMAGFFVGSSVILQKKGY